MIDKCFNNIKYTEKQLRMYPSLADAVAISSDTSDWGPGSWVELVPADTITEDFLIVGVEIRLISLTTTRTWELQVGKGAGGSETVLISIGGMWAYVSSVGYLVTSHIHALPLAIKVDANTRIAMRAADDSTSALSYRCKLHYVELPL